MATKLMGTGMRLAAAVIMAASAAASCVGAQREAELNEARQSWADANIDDYSWTVQKSCFCIDLPGAVEITVSNGLVTGTSVPVDATYPQTVEDLFQIIEDNLEADDLSVRYHPDFGYPEDIRIDRYAEAVDDELFFASGDFAR